MVGGNGNNADGREVDFVIWWLIAKPKYPTVFKMLIAILSIFHGLCVESTVNFMRDVIDKHSGRMSIETYSSFQDIKFAMKAWKFSVENRSVKEFRRDNSLFTSNNPTLVSNMSNAYIYHSREQNKKRETEKRKEDKFEVEVNKIARTRLTQKL